MANDKSDKQRPESSSGKKPSDGMSMKERILARRRAEAAAAEEAPAAPPVPAAKPAQRAAAAAAAARSEAKEKAAAAPAPRAEKPRVKLASARDEERSSRRDRKPVSEDVRREVEMLRKSQDKWITYGWIVALGLLVVAGGTYYVTSSRKKAIEAAYAEEAAAREAFVKKFEDFDINNPAHVTQAEALIADEANKELWNTQAARDKINRILTTMRLNREAAATKDALRQGLEGLEQIANTASSQPSEELAKHRRRMGEYEGATDMGLEFGQRVSKVKVQLDRAFVAKVHEEAKALAAKGPSEARAALTFYTKAEDEVIRLLDEAAKKRIDDLKDYYAGHFKEMIVESDALATAVFTPEVIDKTPWLDLLTADQKENWQQPGFTGWQLDNGVIHAVTDLGSRATAIMSIGDREQWRDYVVEIEFTLLKGDATLHLRLGRSVTNATYNWLLPTTGSNPYKAGTTNSITATLIGSELKLNFSDPDRTQQLESFGWTMSRKGGIGVSVPPGCEIKVSKMRIKALR
ncbi:MAG: hypothetical protein JNL28_10780 [Planctomycetes bacterium]|nr:hypothetical protein [Planctomycetota bacterium]